MMDNPEGRFLLARLQALIMRGASREEARKALSDAGFTYTPEQVDAFLEVAEFSLKMMEAAARGEPVDHDFDDIVPVLCGTLLDELEAGSATIDSATLKYLLTSLRRLDPVHPLLER